jgi:adenine-specific DNA-methyltransferase
MYIQTPFNFTGSKFGILDQIIPLFDTSKETFVDLFAGGGSVYTNAVHMYKNIIVNDKIKELIGIQEKLLQGDEIIEEVKNLSVPCKTSQEEYNKLRASYNEKKSPEKLYALMLSCTNNMLRMNKRGDMNQTWGRRCFNNSTEKKINDFVEYLRPEFNRINFISMSFEEVPIIKNSMYYIDPPYGSVQDENGNITNIQISEAGYNIIWKQEDDIKLYEYCLKLNDNKSSFMMSGVLSHNGKLSWILNRLIKDGFNYHEIKCDYNKVSRKGKKETFEIIIKNY